MKKEVSMKSLISMQRQSPGVVLRRRLRPVRLRLQGLRPVRAGALQDEGVVRQGLRDGRDPRGPQECPAVQPVQLIKYHINNII